MAVHGAELWRGAIELAEWARDQIVTLPGLRCLGDELLGRDGVTEFDPTRLTISACDLGLSGYELETVLRDDYRIAVEAADPLNVVLNVTFGDNREDLELLVRSLRDLAARPARPAAAAPPRPPPCSRTRRRSRGRSSRRATPSSRRPSPCRSPSAPAGSAPRW